MSDIDDIDDPYDKRLDDHLQWAEDHGYRRGRCPGCGVIVWTDTIFECTRCGTSEDEDEDGNKPEVAEEPAEPEPEEQE